MNGLRFQQWVRTAVSRIVLPQDKIIAGRELMGHMEDRFQEYRDQDMPEQEAEVRTLADMGNPQDIAEELGLLHRPFWGRMQLWSGRILRWVAILMLFSFAGMILSRLFFIGGFTKPVYYRYNPFEDVAYFDAAGQYQRLWYGEPKTFAWSDGYLFTVSDAAVWEAQPYGGEHGNNLHIQVHVFSPITWAWHDNVIRYFWAIDDQGNVYGSNQGNDNGQTSAILVRDYHSAPLTRMYDLSVSEYIPEDIQWVELHYERSGRELVMRIDLMGGDES